ncbi:MAG: ATP synthase F0 subunit B [Planctomycetia bacterium]|nr:ATP synthase F0 subunit B [Planctomycetia bacterium]
MPRRLSRSDAMAAGKLLSGRRRPRRCGPVPHVQRSSPVEMPPVRIQIAFVAAVVLICGASLCVDRAVAAAPEAEDSHAAHAGGHHDGGDHGGHGVEIGHGAPPGVTTDKFESPAWFSRDLAVWSFVVFLGLLGLLTKFAWKPIMEGLEKREEGIARQIAETKAANEEAKRMLASYERRLAEAAEEVRGMLEEARRDAEGTRQAIVAEARKAADDEQARAKREIQLAKDDALSQIAEKAGHLAVEVAGKFLRERLGPDEQARLVRDSVASLSSRPSVN